MPLIPKNRSNLAMSMMAKQRGLLPKGVLEVHSPYQNCLTLHYKNHFVKDCQGFECYFNNIQRGSSLHSAQLQLIQHWFSQMKLKTKVAGSCHLYQCTACIVYHLVAHTHTVFTYGRFQAICPL